MRTDPARQEELRTQIAKEMADALGTCDFKTVRNALESSLDMHHAHIEEEISEDCCEKQHHHSGRNAG